MYTHLMTLEQIERAYRSPKELNNFMGMFDRLLEMALEQDVELQRLLEDNDDLKDKNSILAKKVIELEEYKYMYESVSK